MADTLDVLTLDEVKASINLATSVATHDTELARFITAVSRRLDDLCGPIVKRTVTDEPHDGGRPQVFFDKTPIASVTTVKEYSGTTLTTLTAESVSSQVADQYLLDSRLGLLYRRSGGSDSTFATGRRNILVTYSAGRYDNTATVDPKFKVAAGLILQEMWRPHAGAWAQSADPYSGPLPSASVNPWAALPKAARDILADELRAPAVA